jgi:extracellular elastinolytic metalloproteinase
MRRPRNQSRALAGLVALVTATGLALAAGSNSPALASRGDNARHSGTQGDTIAAKDKDNRHGRVSPSATQRAKAGALDATVSWNGYGTPQTLLSRGAPLATGLGRDAAAAARAYIAGNRQLLGLSKSAANSLELLAVAPMGKGAAVLFRQRFGSLRAGVDGLLAIGVRNGSAFYVSSSLSRSSAAPAAATLSAAAARGIAIKDSGRADAKVMKTELVAVPTAAGARAAYLITLGADVNGANGSPVAYATYVDARDGSILLREDLVDHDSDNPEWAVFPNTPPNDYSSNDTRVIWCATATAGCDEVVGSPASPLSWDAFSGTGPTFTTTGNNAFAVHNWFSNNPFTVGTELATPSPTREYTYPWTNQWREQRCNPDTTFTSPQRNDIDAARANLLAMHSREHDWSYHLGFTEALWNMQRDNFGKGGLGNDVEQGNAQAGGVTGGPASGFAARDNANQITPGDGIAPITNMYLWQPIAAAFYTKCVDGDFDMSVIGHEYGHAITNRMINGPTAGFSSPQGMSESWSDLIAMEIVNEHGYANPGVRAYTIGEYVTTDPIAGIRNYNMSQSPLNYSSIDYDFVGLQVHASGETWSATNFDIRSAMIARYGAGTAALQKSCANGETPVTSCPGNRRWAQLMFDSFPLMTFSPVSMVDSRNAMLAADMIRFGGANQDILWNAFAKRGLGEGAVSNGAGDANPTPGFTSPFANEATVTFRPVDENDAIVPSAQLFVGDYQARAVPVADTDPATPLTNQVQLVPGTYSLIASAPGHGHARITSFSVNPGQVRDLQVKMRTNLASAGAGASASGDGINLARLIDDDEATNWASLGSSVAGKQVTVDLAGGAQQVRRVQVSAQLRPAITGDPDAGGQARVSALRQFRILACEAKGAVTCTNAADFHAVFTSASDAFPSIAPRPRAPELTIRSFAIPDTKATHLRIEVLTNQCTGAPAYAGDQDDDPLNVTDCAAGSTQDDNVRIAEFQAFAL